jgi:hypothetical protein
MATWRNMGSSEPIKLLDHFESDQVYAFWLIQTKLILIQRASASRTDNVRLGIQGGRGIEANP